MHAQEVKQLVYLSVIVIRMKTSQSGDRGKHNKSVEIIEKIGFIMYLARPTSITNAVLLASPIDPIHYKHVLSAHNLANA